MKVIVLIISFLYCSVASAQLLVSNETAYLDCHPVSNKNWFTFLQFLTNDPTFSKQYVQSMKPDQWRTNPKQNAPVIGVSWQQALAYCEWRSVIETYLVTHKKVAPYQHMQQANKTAKTQIMYRLPTGKEFDRLSDRMANTTYEGISFRCIYSVKRAI